MCDGPLSNRVDESPGRFWCAHQPLAKGRKPGARHEAVSPLRPQTWPPDRRNEVTVPCYENRILDDRQLDHVDSEKNVDTLLLELYVSLAHQTCALAGLAARCSVAVVPICQRRTVVQNTAYSLQALPDRSGTTGNHSSTSDPSFQPTSQIVCRNQYELVRTHP